MNQHSFLLIGFLVLVLVGAIGLRFGRRVCIGIVGGLAVVFTIAFGILRTGSGDFHTPHDLEVALRAGRPVVVEFYSDY